MQMVLREDGRVEKEVRGPRIDQGGDGDGRLAGNEELKKKNQVTGGREREWGEGRESAT